MILQGLYLHRLILTLLMVLSLVCNSYLYSLHDLLLCLLKHEF